MVAMPQSLDLVVSPEVVEHQPYILEGLEIHIAPLAEGSNSYRLALMVEPDGPWAHLAGMAADDPEALDQWCKIAIKQLNRALAEGMDSLQLPMVIPAGQLVPLHLEDQDQGPEPEPELKGWWARLRQSFARRPVSAS
jgi:hypothetical protein